MAKKAQPIVDFIANYPNFVFTTTIYHKIKQNRHKIKLP